MYGQVGGVGWVGSDALAIATLVDGGGRTHSHKTPEFVSEFGQVIVLAHDWDDDEVLPHVFVQTVGGLDDSRQVIRVCLSKRGSADAVSGHLSDAFDTVRVVRDFVNERGDVILDRQTESIRIRLADIPFVANAIVCMRPVVWADRHGQVCNFLFRLGHEFSQTTDLQRAQALCAQGHQGLPVQFQRFDFRQHHLVLCLGGFGLGHHEDMPSIRDAVGIGEHDFLLNQTVRDLGVFFHGGKVV